MRGSRVRGVEGDELGYAAVAVRINNTFQTADMGGLRLEMASIDQQ